MSKTAQIPFVLGGEILDRRYPSILQANPEASARRRNRTMTEEEWDQFCDEFEEAMSWSRNWPACILSRPVVIAFSLFLPAVVLLILTRATPTTTPIIKNNQTLAHGYFHAHPADTFLTREILPDMCVFFLLVLAIAMVISMIRLSFQLHDSVSRVCDDYTSKFQDYCGISFSVQKKRALASPPWRGHQTAKQSRRTTEFRSFLYVTRDEEDATSRYQNVVKHPQDEIGNPPFFDVIRVPPLLHPQTKFSKAINEPNV